MLPFPTTPRAPDPSVAAALARLHQLHPKVIDLSLGRTLGLLEKLGRPQDRLPPVVHVAGTNGKGSVIANLRAIFEAAGMAAHVYTSPHLVRFNERIRLAGEIIGNADLVALFEECERANGGDIITFFEITTAAALLAYSRTPADVLLLETGLGGRYDATNVIDRPAMTVITPVSMDHMDFLGDTIRQIAAEKGAIQKRDVPSVIGPQMGQAAKVILAQAEEAGAPAFVFGRDWRIRPHGAGFRYRSVRIELDLPAPGLAGRHQLFNAGTAVACVEQLEGFEISDKAIFDGLPAAEWPARMQPLTEGALGAMLPAGWELWLDGGHNPGAGAALAETVSRWKDKPLHLVIGMMRRKPVQNFLRPLAPWVKSVRGVAIPGHEECYSGSELAEAALEVEIPEAKAALDVEAAIADIMRVEKKPARILICGSLYLAGAVLARNEDTEPMRTAG
ncbi:MAG: bifunctional folylpolyglutamate synthase/dihydrofolate synthase [Alphaproteobacteria bacterium]|nr:bifunctional folylpolyglutamate synthase/dihydrofolate synthase [Alphaproteobacteria bacterium]